MQYEKCPVCLQFIESKDYSMHLTLAHQANIGKPQKKESESRVVSLLMARYSVPGWFLLALFILGVVFAWYT